MQQMFVVILTLESAKSLFFCSCNNIESMSSQYQTVSPIIAPPVKVFIQTEDRVSKNSHVTTMHRLDQDQLPLKKKKNSFLCSLWLFIAAKGGSRLHNILYIRGGGVCRFFFQFKQGAHCFIYKCIPKTYSTSLVKLLCFRLAKK
ncbi:uncharacterized protein EV154DRAFT_251730 [Mucor mucedo]|uniref:uncharacterized protein n=1 Tax=Mucor mucedo TaxID=29922 RepID=UPI00221FDEA1|nr:uncharacterized protein EV154DRAFT_251730 [Mucor mucedo]KAI7890409.1 hypothetical protein EV154DRAFT_251730 [Mucor mucedo]